MPSNSNTPIIGRCATSNSKDWCTPPRIVDAVSAFFGGFICLDPCSNPHSVVHALESYALPERDGLKEHWLFENVFVNPPYGRDKARGTSIYDWVKKCSDTHAEIHNEIIALIPVATNTAHWKEFVFPTATSICFLKDTRLRFLENGVESKKGAPMACALVYWGYKDEEFESAFDGKFGAVVSL